MVPREERRPGRAVSRAVTGPYIYVAGGRHGAIEIFLEKETLQHAVGSISDGVKAPYGLYVDKHGNLYVANQTGSVTVYPKGAISPSITYQQDLSRPLYPIVDRFGNVFVGNAGGGSVVEYVGGSTQSTQVLVTPGYEADGLAFDPAGTLYVAYRAHRHAGIVTFAAGSAQFQKFPMSLDQPQGLIVDSHFNILVVETGDRDRIDLFEPGKKKPSAEVQVPNGDTPTQISLVDDEKTLLVSTLSGAVYAIPYPLPAVPSLKDQLRGLIQGVAGSNDQI
jgi:hypothetical protein